MAKVWEPKEIEKLKELVLNGNSTYLNIADELGRTYDSIKHAISRHVYEVDDEIISENIKIAKEKQGLQDNLRIARKSFREKARVENAIIKYEEKLIEVLNKYQLPKTVVSSKIDIKNKNFGILHLTDLHFNELVDLKSNKYDFKIASKRLYKLVAKTKQYFKNSNISQILIALTGDILNSDRRLDELLSAASNRSRATFLAVSLLEQVILDLSKDFKVTVASVSGNESRLMQEIGWSEGMVTDNYDYTIHHILKFLFRKTNVNFIDSDFDEVIVEICNKKILLLHGHQISGKVEHAVQKIKGKYASQNIVIDFVMFGHLHSCRIGDSYSRGASLVGSNGYSNNKLQLESRASQNIHFFYQDGSRDSMKIDLQDANNIGYDINEELEAYNIKSLDKIRKKTTVFKLII